MAKILISYRRRDSAAITGRIADRLTAHYGRDAVFVDVDSIPLGVDFRTHIDEVMSVSDIALVIIGTQWLGNEAEGRLRIHDEDDPVRIEVEAALTRNIPVIPVLVDRVGMPKATQLPESLKSLSFRNAAEIDVGRDFHQQVDRLIRSMDLLLKRSNHTRSGAARPESPKEPKVSVNKTVVEAPLVPASRGDPTSSAAEMVRTPAGEADSVKQPLLAVENLQAWYGESHILHGVNFEVREGEVVTLLGRNGAGKTTTLKSIMGIVAQRTGSVRLEGKELIRRTSDRIARAGIAICPEERGIFASLNVQENLVLPPEVRPGGLALSRVFDLFPNVKERLRSSQGTKLSGGEQQMLAIGRILRTGARLLLLDEPTEGLAPVIIKQIGNTIRTLKAQGFTILLVEQNFRFAATVADRYYVMEHGKIVERFANSELDANMEKLHEYLGV